MPMNGEVLVKPDKLYIKTQLHGILFTMQYFPAFKRSKCVLMVPCTRIGFAAS